MPYLGDPGLIPWMPRLPDNPPPTNIVRTAALCADSFFFAHSKEYALSDLDDAHLWVSKWQIPNIDIVPRPKDTLSQAIRASIYEQTLAGVDVGPGATYDLGKDQWDEQINPKGINKWRPTYPDIVPTVFHKQLSQAIQASLKNVFVGYSQSVGNWNPNPMPVSLVPADFMIQSREYLPQWPQDIKKNYLNTSIQAGSFAFIDFRDNATKSWLEGERSSRWFPTAPDILPHNDIRRTISSAILAGSFFHANFVNAAKTWVEDYNKESWRPKYDDIIPIAKAGLPQSIQAGSFWQPPFMSLAINYKSYYIDERSANNPDIIMQPHFAIKKTLLPAIYAGSFFNVEPSDYPTKTWVVSIDKIGWDCDYPDIIPVAPKRLSQAILAGSFNFIGYGDDNTTWNEDIDPSNWTVTAPDMINPIPKIPYCQYLTFVEQGTDGWEGSGGIGPYPVIQVGKLESDVIAVQISGSFYMEV